MGALGKVESRTLPTGFCDRWHPPMPASGSRMSANDQIRLLELEEVGALQEFWQRPEVPISLASYPWWREALCLLA